MAKTSKSAKSERQKLIDAAMNQQRGAEKRRTNLIVTVSVVIALLLIGAAAYRPVKGAFDEAKLKDVALSDIGGPASVCEKVVTKDATGVSSHVDQGVQVAYDAAPPAYGQHWNVAGIAPAPFDDKFYDKDDRPELEALVHNLEHGYTILWYDDSVADDAGQLAEIRSIAKKFDSDDQNYRLKFIAAPWTEDDEKSAEDPDGKTFPKGQHIAFTHWAGDSDASKGVWQYCSETSGEALETFMADWPYTDSPEAGVI